MALQDQPYLPLYADDWMNNTKLKMCSAGAHGLMISIMCLMHKSDEYGVILLKQKFKQNNKQIINFASQIAKTTSFDLLEVEKYLTELIDEQVLIFDGEKLVSKRMVKDHDISVKRSSSGKKGGKKTQAQSTKFAKAKVQANAVYVNEDVNVIEIEEGKGGIGGKPSSEIPTWIEFLTYGLEKEPSVDHAALKNKYDAWVENGWKDGNDGKIKNWKSKLNHTFPYIKKTTPTSEQMIGRTNISTIQKSYDNFK